MKLAQLFTVPLCVTLLSGCLIPPTSPPERNWSHSATLMVTNIATNGQYSVKASVFEIKSNDLISDSQIESARHQGSFDLLSVSTFTVESGLWSEFRVCSEPYNPYSVEARIGEEDIRLSMSPGVVMKIKVNPITDGKLHCVGVLSIGVTITEDFPGYLRVYPFDVTIPVGEEITILRKTCNQ